MATAERQILKHSAESALFAGEIQGLIITCHQNERPLAGLSGSIDWRFLGALSSAVRAGALTGAAGEIVYFPITRNEQTFHLILVGAGSSNQPGVRSAILPPETLKGLKKNLAQLKLDRIGLSRADFGGISDQKIQDTLGGTSIWIAP